MISNTLRPINTNSKPKPNMMTNTVATSKRLFTAEGKHSMSSDDESDSPSVLLCGQRKRRKTLIIPAKPPSPKYDSSDDEEWASAVHHRSLLRRRKSMVLPACDRAARQRCFDYLLSAIDAVWAEYCDSTSHAEEQMYMPCSPVSEEEQEPSRYESVCAQPQSMRLMRLKSRLLDAKYVMIDLVGNVDPDSSSQFWKRWDTLKYATVEAVEGDDEDCDTVIEDLEAGRYWV